MKKIWKWIGTGVATLLVAGAVVWLIVFFTNPERRALAEGRRDIARRLAEPLDLSAHYDKPAGNIENEWTAVPGGFQTFCHVPFQIDGSLQLWGAGFPAYGGGSGAEECGHSREPAV